MFEDQYAHNPESLSRVTDAALATAQSTRQDIVVVYDPVGTAEDSHYAPYCFCPPHFVSLLARDGLILKEVHPDGSVRDVNPLPDPEAFRRGLNQPKAPPTEPPVC